MSEIVAYYDFMGHPKDWRRGMFMRIIDKLDEKYMEHMQEIQKKASRKQTGQGGRPRVR